ncbi:hypothetical protein ACFPQ5_08810 [Massilia suwonensis]|uniref:Uncharacterized protein n=2 Tax=Massilia suwonensis TaxID=648895 RepID=A0ABW0MM70_9BURK
MKAVFDERGKAEQALDRLLGSGYARADARLVTVHGATPAVYPAARIKWREHSGTSAVRFLSRFLLHARGNAASAADRPQSPDSYLLTLVIDSESEGDRAASLVPSLVRTGSDDTWDGTARAFRFARHLHESERFRNRSWNDATGDLKVLWEAHDCAGAQWDQSEPALHLGWESTRPESDDDAYLRSHWNTRYFPYLRHPAQVTVRRDPGPVLGAAVRKAAWKRKHPGELTPWENFMDAVKYGWERSTLGNDTSEAGYRLHLARTYPHMNYDDVAPVYRYGNNLRRRRAFRGRSWDDVEPEIRAEWERGRREGKPLTWDETRAAMHHAWDQAG